MRLQSLFIVVSLMLPGCISMSSGAGADAAAKASASGSTGTQGEFLRERFGPDGKITERERFTGGVRTEQDAGAASKAAAEAESANKKGDWVLIGLLILVGFQTLKPIIRSLGILKGII